MVRTGMGIPFWPLRRAWDPGVSKDLAGLGRAKAMPTAQDNIYQHRVCMRGACVVLFGPVQPFSGLLLAGPIANLECGGLPRSPRTQEDNKQSLY